MRIKKKNIIQLTMCFLHLIICLVSKLFTSGNYHVFVGSVYFHLREFFFVGNVLWVTIDVICLLVWNDKVSDILNITNLNKYFGEITNLCDASDRNGNALAGVHSWGEHLMVTVMMVMMTTNVMVMFTLCTLDDW